MKDHASAVKNRPGDYAWTVSDHDAQDNAELRAEGINTKNAKKDVILGLQKVKARMKVQGDGYPRLFICKRCKNVIREFGSYRWPETRATGNDKEEPMKENDHAMDAIRYMVMEIDRGSGRAPAVSAGMLGL
jgi:phage terminase large subunit